MTLKEQPSNLLPMLTDHYAGKFSPAHDYLLDTLDPDDPLYLYLLQSPPGECKWEGLLSSWTTSDYTLVTRLPLTQVTFIDVQPLLRDVNSLSVPTWDIYICLELYSDGVTFLEENYRARYTIDHWIPSDFSPEYAGKILSSPTKEQALQEISNMAITWALEKVAKENK